MCSDPCGLWGKPSSLAKAAVTGTFICHVPTVMCAFTSLLVGVWKLHGYDEMVCDPVASCFLIPNHVVNQTVLTLTNQKKCINIYSTK